MAKNAYQQALSYELSLRGKAIHWNSSPEFLRCSCYAGLAALARKRGNKKQAIRYYKKALEIDPEHATSLHFLAAIGKIPQPPRASDDYVAALFDEHAEYFGDHLVTDLQYRTTEIL